MYSPHLFITFCCLEESKVWFFSGECQIESYGLCLCLRFLFLRSTLDHTKIREEDNETRMLQTVPSKILKKTLQFDSWPLSMWTNFWLAIMWQ